MEISGQEDGNRGDGLPICFGAKVRGERHFTNIEFEAADHAPHRGDDGIDLNVFEIQIRAANASILQRLGKAVIADGDCEWTHLICSVRIGRKNTHRRNSWQGKRVWARRVKTRTAIGLAQTAPVESLPAGAD